MADRETIINKIRKLLALSQSNNQHEAEMAAAKASALMEEYQIELSEMKVIDSDIQKDIFYTRRAKWCFMLAAGCAELFDSRALYSANDATMVVFVGTRTNLDAAKMMYEYLMISWDRISDFDFSIAKFNGLSTHGKAFKAAHGLGFAKSIRYRANQLADERKGKVSAHSSNGTALIVMNDQKLNEYMAGFGPGKTRKYTTKSNVGYTAGVNAGKNIHLGNVVEGGSTVQIR